MTRRLLLPERRVLLPEGRSVAPITTQLNRRLLLPEGRSVVDIMSHLTRTGILLIKEISGRIWTRQMRRIISGRIWTKQIRRIPRGDRVCGVGSLASWDDLLGRLEWAYDEAAAFVH
jgi:hypothetical protein